MHLFTLDGLFLGRQQPGAGGAATFRSSGEKPKLEGPFIRNDPGTPPGNG